jgi:tetratricopeptide (TPR) repeat protein
MSTLHRRAKDVFLAALERPPAERAAFVAASCGGDADLAREVESLLAFHDDEEAGTDASADLRQAAFAPGEVFAGRYRMITRIGRGGMGDVWRADDLVLETPVALKLIDPAGPVGRERILKEVRFARQITHPAVCRVFDVGESDGWMFFSMELVQGEDLATLLRRVGRLPSDRVADIARQLAAGLAAAHAQNVLHRDLKPANVLIDNDGQVRITDFGIAISRSDPNAHKLTGTPGYMAPEQRSPGTSLSERTDIYSLGLLLYELLVGRYPFSGVPRTARPPAPSTLVPNVHPDLERAVMQALSPDPDERQASAQAFAAGLPDIGVPREGTGPAAVRHQGRIPWWVAAAGLAVVVGIVAVASSFFVSTRTARLTERDTIVIADFENTTGEPVFDGALKVALAVALEQSPFLMVYPDDRARETLRLMERPPDTRITRAIAREIAQREHLKALIAGSIASLGSNYVIAVEALNAETGDVMAREQAEATSKEQVLTSIGVATSRLREKLGESLASVQRFDAPLAKATTPSLEALHAYSLALSDGRVVPRLEAIPHLKRAIEIDPTFAMAHALLSGVYANTGQTTLAPAYSRRAIDLRDRVSERERFFISWRYYRDAAQNWEQALELARAWTVTYPREPFAFNSLGAALLSLGRFAESVEPFKEAIRLDPRFSPPYSNLAAALVALDRIEEARGVLRDAADRKLDFIGARRLAFLIAFQEGDTATMRRALEASIGVGETNAAFGWQAHASATGGQLTAAHEQFHRGVETSLQGHYPEVAAQLTAEDAEVHALAGQCSEARSEGAAAVGMSRDLTTLERTSRALALCGDAGVLQNLPAELTRRFPEATLTIRLAVPVSWAALALAQGEAARVIDVLETVTPYEHAPSAEFWPAYLRGLAALRLKDGARAAASFGDILRRRGEVPASMIFPLAELGAARAAALTGRTDEARQAYDAFARLWKDADAGLQAVRDARAEAAALR